MSIRKPNCNYNLLCGTIKEKDKVTARTLILNNANVNIPTARGNTPLHWAILKFRDLDIMTMLLDRGANVHARNRFSQKPLDVAIQNKKIKAAQLLIRRGALVGEDLSSLLLMAIDYNNDNIVKTLIDHEIQTNPSNDLKILLNIAISRGQSKMIEHILPHFRFLTSSDQYIPREAVLYSGPQCKECVELLLKWNFSVNPHSKNDEEFVYAAVEKGYLPIVLQLLELGIDVNLMNSKTGLNLLKVACFNSHHEIVENLLKHNACLNVKTPTNTEILNDLVHNSCNHLVSLTHDKNNLRDITCLHIAVLNSDPKMTKLLLRYGATIIDDSEFFNITCIAVRNNCEKIIRIFLDHGVNVNDINSKKKTLLHYCLLSNANEQDTRYNISKLLLDQGATIHIQTPGNSLLFEAVKNGHRRTALLFLDYNADIQYISPDGNNLLHQAVGQHYDVEFIQILLKRNVQVNAVNNKMHTPLLVACKKYVENPLENIEALLDYDANIDCADNNLMTPLHNACQARNLEVVTVLLKRGANPNTTNNKGQTPLHLVCEQNYISLASSHQFKIDNNIISTLIQLLLQYNAYSEAVDAKGWTPLFLACQTSNDKAVTCLLDHHANGNHTDLEKLTPLYIAAHNCRFHLKVIKILLERKVNVHCIDKWGNSVIHILVENNVSNIVKQIADTQINFNSINKKGNTPLHIAVEKRYIGMIEDLIKYGANVNILDKNKRTVLQSTMKCMFDLRNKFERPCVWFMGQSFPLDYFNEDTATIVTTMYDHKEIKKILTIQIVKLKVAGLKVNNQDLKIIYRSNDNESSDEEFSDDEIFYAQNYEKINILQLEFKCLEEIKKMNTESIGVNNITFYDFLTRNLHFLCRFVKNKKIRKTLKLEVYDAMFPLYMDIVRSRFRDAKFRYRMMDSAKKYLTSNITQQLSDDCIDTVFSYLNIKDLKMFIRAMKPLNG